MAGHVRNEVKRRVQNLSAGGASFKPRFAPESGGHVPLEGGVKRHLHSNVGQQGNKLTENPYGGLMSTGGVDEGRRLPEVIWGR